MELIINGETQNFGESISIAELLRELNIEERIVAISLNSHVVKKGAWENTVLQNNDKLELLQFMSGG
ncbi:sulfur carrier protein ThiS [Helicobacter sp. MIT 14-3879]|uniref:sulfur carrier protein ThiS n=1 Tax=Helicobacter sp. MIT 14-3879 TaxID=2040649 RepID=UPI000E1F5D9D|nr:sulfur carrier protein ThiS [Helicobacter sp. MIT 14-3879]RDU59976.1 thiamine biosynthesis protein ThiS [Helicobacter sp. MIT 14-3879]